MKALLFGDTHGDFDFSHLEARAEMADLIFCCGDITDFSLQLQEALEALHDFAERINKDIILTHGNHEGCLRKQVLRFPRFRYVHKESIVIKDILITGYGGGGFAKSNEDFERFMQEEMRAHTHKKRVWLMHGPPHDVELDHVPWAGATGCHTKRAMIERHQPNVVIVGHIHQGWGMEHRLGNSRIVNPGPDGLLIDLFE